MARLQAVRREQVEGADVEPRSGTGGVVALLLFVVAVAALGEVVAGRRLQALRDRLDATDALPMAVHLPR